MAEAKLAVLDPKSALVVAVQQLTADLVGLRDSGAPADRIRDVAARLEAIKISIAERVDVSPAAVEAARAGLAEVLADPTATAAEVAEARAALAEARTPSLEEVTQILGDGQILGAREADHLLPIIIPGVVDAPKTGNLVFLDDSRAKSMQVVRINDTAVRLTSNEGFNLTISTRDKNGQPFRLGAGGSIVVKHGNFISIAGQGFASNSTARTWLFSSPRELGSLDVADDGSFSADHPITEDVKPGLHTAQVNGLSPDGEVRSLSIAVEIIPNDGQAPYDPLSKRSDVVQLTAELLTLMAVAGGAAGATRGGKRDNDDEGGEGTGDDEREAADVNEVSAGRGGVGVLARADTYTPPVVAFVDRLFAGLAHFAAARSALFARIVGDGAYLRALAGVAWTTLPLVGVMLGVIAARDVDFAAGIPSLSLILAIVLVGAFDALAGLSATAAFTLAVAAAGGITSADSIRGLLGFAVLAFGVPLVAGATRPFRREHYGNAPIWSRFSDVVVLSLVGAWGAGSMFGALPGLFGVTHESADRGRLVQGVVLLALVARYVAEQVAASFTANRLASLEVSATEPVASRRVTTSVAQTALFVFVAVVFIGNNWALWLGAALYLVPKIVAIFNGAFPRSRRLDAWLPKGVTRTVLMLVVAKWWAELLDNAIDDAATMLQVGFVALGLPALVLTALGWFAGGAPKRASTPLTRLGGVIVVVVGVLIVLGVINL